MATTQSQTSGIFETEKLQLYKPRVNYEAQQHHN